MLAGPGLAGPAPAAAAKPVGRVYRLPDGRLVSRRKAMPAGAERRALRRRYSAQTGRCSMPSSARAFWASFTVALRRPCGSSIGSSNRRGPDLAGGRHDDQVEAGAVSVDAAGGAGLGPAAERLRHLQQGVGGGRR